MTTATRLTRPNLDQRARTEAIRMLEWRLGVKVFDRTSRRVRLTSAGESLRRDLVPALDALDRVLAQASELSESVRGLLRIGFVLTTEGPALNRLVPARSCPSSRRPSRRPSPACSSPRPPPLSSVRPKAWCCRPLPSRPQGRRRE